MFLLGTRKRLANIIRPGMRKFLQQSHLLAVHAKQSHPVSSLILKGFEGASNSFKLLDLLYETRIAPSGRICLARSSQPRSQGFSLFVIGKAGKGPGTGRSSMYSDWSMTRTLLCK